MSECATIPIETSIRVVHQITASTHLARAAASTASLNACGVRLHWLMTKLKTTTILEYIGFAPFLALPSPDGRPARPLPYRSFQFLGASVSSLPDKV